MRVRMCAYVCVRVRDREKETHTHTQREREREREREIMREEEGLVRNRPLPLSSCFDSFSVSRSLMQVWRQHRVTIYLRTPGISMYTTAILVCSFAASMSLYIKVSAKQLILVLSTSKLKVSASVSMTHNSLSLFLINTYVFCLQKSCLNVGSWFVPFSIRLILAHDCPEMIRLR